MGERKGEKKLKWQKRRSAMSKEQVRLKEIIQILECHNILKDRSPENIRSMIEELGPTFVKMGQILASRSDLIPESISNELKKLRCSVKPMVKSEVEEILRREYDDKVKEIFLSFDNTPIGSASIAQTHIGTLKNGEKVAIKIQRKDIYQKMTTDAKLLKKAVSILQIDRLFSNVVDLKAVIDEMYMTAKEEMDFLIEANNSEEFANNNGDILYIKPLKIYKEYSTPYILVMEYIDGPFINDKEKLMEFGYDMEEVSLKLADNYIKQAIDDGFYHADPHCDNIKIQDGKIVYLDFGMMGRLSNKNKRLLNDCILAILKNDVTEIAHILTILDTNSHTVDYMKLTKDIKNILSKNKATEIVEINIKEFASDMFELLNSNQITLPRDITLLMRGIVVLEGLLEELAPTISLMTVLKNRLRKENIVSREQVIKALTVGIQNGTDLFSIPSEALSLLKGINSGELRFNIELNDSKNKINRFEDLFHQAIVTVLDVSFIIGISLMIMNHKANQSYPFVFFLYIALSIAFTGWLFVKMFYSKITRKK